MGCSITSVIEYQDTDQRWHTFCRVWLSRDYNLFGLLAGVRGDLEPLIQPRGLPDDLAFWTETIGFEDLHTASWLTLEELKMIANRMTVYDFDLSELNRVINIMDCFHIDLKPSRFIFGFDS